MTALEIFRYDQDELSFGALEALEKFQLWYADFEEAGIDRCYIAWVGDEIAGFQTVDYDGRCTAIEVAEKFQGQGIASALVEESGCWKPDRNENPEFWERMEEKFGW